MKILVVIPAYNEEETILKTVQDLRRCCPQCDYIVVNDGSTDQTGRVCHGADMQYLRLPANLGIGGGVQTGYKYAVENEYDVVVQMDGDGQHDPAYIDALIQPVLAGDSDMVIGSRFGESEGFQSSPARRTGIALLGRIIRFCTGKRITDATSGFRATGKGMTAFFAQHYAHDYPEPEAIVLALLHGFSVAEVPVRMRKRTGGVSSIGPIRSVYYMVKVSTALMLHKIGTPQQRRR